MRKRTGIAQLLQSKLATALPVSFLILFVSLTLIVSATYYISVTKIQARGQILNIAVSKQNMAHLENIIGLTKWSPGTSMVSRFEDSGGRFITDPDAQPLLVNITNGTFSTVLFNSSVGEASYELPAADIMQLEKGDILQLDQRKDSLLPGYIAGQLKYMGTPGIHRGNIAYLIKRKVLDPEKETI